MTNQQLASRILELVGGKENVISAINCMTRLRITLKDSGKANLQELKQTEGVLGVVEQQPLQVILGPGKAKKVKEEFLVVAGLDLKDSDEATSDNDWQSNKQMLKSQQTQGGMKSALANIANIFIPMMPAIISAGLFAGVAGALGQTALGKEQLEAQAGSMFVLITLFQLLGFSFLAYFTIFTGMNAAKCFGATPALGGMIGAMNIMPQIVTLSTAFGLYNEAVPMDSILTNGKGGIIGVIFGVWILSKIERGFRRIIPDVVDLILTPFFAVMITGILFVFAIMPAAGFASDLLVRGLDVLVNSDNSIISVLSGYILSALFLPMVLLGLHHGLTPIYALQLEALNVITLFPVVAMAGAGQVGAAIAIYFKARRVRNTRMQKVITGAIPAGILGIGEPLIYGVTLPLGKAFITAGLGAGFGGAFVRLMNVTSIAWGTSGVVAIPLMSTPRNMLFFFVGLVISYFMGFLVTMLVMKDDEVKQV